MTANLMLKYSGMRLPFGPMTLLVVFSILPACAQSPQQQAYTISIGTSAEKILSGTIWLFSYSWYGLQKIQLAAIRKV